MLSGKSRLLFGILMLSAIFLAVFYWEETVSFTFLYGLILLMLLAMLQAILAPRLIRVQRERRVYTARRGEQLVYRLKLICRGGIPYVNILLRHDPVPWGQLEDKLIYQMRGSSRIVSFTLCFPYRGIYPLKLRDVGVSDCLGLFRRRFRPGLEEAGEVIVLPGLIPGFALPLDRRARERLSPRRNFVREIRTEPGDVRQYNPGDDYRQVHWKLSAKFQDLVVKQFPSAEPEKLRLFLDTRSVAGEEPERLEIEDRMVTLAASAARFCSDTGLDAVLLWDRGLSAYDLPPRGDLTGLYRLLAGLPFDGDDQGLGAFCSGLLGGDAVCDVVVILAGLDAAACEALSQVCRQEHRLVLYLAGEPEPDLETAARIRSLEGLGAQVRPVCTVDGKVEVGA